MCQNEHKKETVVEKSLAYKEELAEYEQVRKENLKKTLEAMLSKGEKWQSQIKDKFSAKNKKYVLKNVFEFIEQSILVRVESVQVELERAERRAHRRIERYRVDRKNAHTKELDEIERKFQILRANKSGVDALSVFDVLVQNVASLRARFSYEGEEYEIIAKDKINHTFSNEPRCYSHRLMTHNKVHFFFSSYIYIYHQ